MENGEILMKKLTILMITLILISGLLSACQKQAALGDTLIKVTGDIGKTNSGNAYILDEAAFEKHSVELTIDDPWMGDGLKYKGILLKDLIDIVDPADSAKTFSLVATDGKAVDVAIADAEKWDIMLVHWADGAILDEKTGGPVKIAFSADARATYPDDMWMWWVVEVKVK